VRRPCLGGGGGRAGGRAWVGRVVRRHVVERAAGRKADAGLKRGRRTTEERRRGTKQPVGKPMTAEGADDHDRHRGGGEMKLSAGNPIPACSEADDAESVGEGGGGEGGRGRGREGGGRGGGRGGREGGREGGLY
jgi:hypothetical protein